MLKTLYGCAIILIAILLPGFSGKTLPAHQLSGLYQSLDAFEGGILRQYLLINRKKEAYLLIDSLVTEKQLKNDLLKEGGIAQVRLSGDSFYFALDSIKCKITTIAEAFGAEHKWISYWYSHSVRHHVCGRIKGDTLKSRIMTICDHSPHVYTDSIGMVRDSLSGKFDTIYQDRIFIRRK